jgi:predicted unusual protein kinase regulating ubiquinone biosynthesis (AarF/ABC1/UbiB family)
MPIERQAPCSTEFAPDTTPPAALAKPVLPCKKVAGAGLRDRDTPLPELARDTAEALGSTYIKLGQLIASSPSLFPHDYVEAFQSCLDQTSPLPFCNN